MDDNLDFSLDVSISGGDLLDKAGRVGRVAWLSSKIRPDDLFLLQDGNFSKVLLSEALECFVNEHYVAAIALGFTVVERALAARLFYRGKIAESKGRSEDLTKAALNLGWIKDIEYENLRRLRKLRNAVMHFKPSTKNQNNEILPEVMDKGKMEIEAKSFIETMIIILGKTAL